jgi:hypothetical protein
MQQAAVEVQGQTSQLLERADGLATRVDQLTQELAAAKAQEQQACAKVRRQCILPFHSSGCPVLVCGMQPQQGCSCVILDSTVLLQANMGECKSAKARYACVHVSCS